MNESMTQPVQTTVESVLQASWRMPLWVVLVTAAGCGLCVYWLYASERGRAGRPARWLLTGIRFSLLMMVLWMLAGWSWLRFKSDPPELIVVLDRSASMDTRDVDDGGQIASQSRWERARQLFEGLDRRPRQALLDRYQLQWYTLAESLESASVDLADTQQPLLSEVTADGPQSRLGDGLLRLLERQAGMGTAAVVLVSDGINTSGAALSDVAKVARRAAVPFYTVVLGRQYELPDLRLTDLLMDRQVYLGDQVSVEVSLVVSDVPAAETRVILRDTASEKVLDEQRIQLGAGERQANVRLSFVPERAGEISIRLEAAAIPGETELANNAVDAVVNVQDKTIRVLLVSRQPSYEFRFLKSFLQRSTQAGEGGAASFELHTVLQDADPAYVEQEPSALRLIPSNPATLADYDVFVLCEFDPQLVSQTSQQAIYEAVTQHGAGCIFVWGDDSPAQRLEGWPLAQLLPVDGSQPAVGTAQLPPGNLSWRPTALGSTALPMQLAASVRESLAVWQRLPAFAEVGRAGQIKAGAQVLAEANDATSGQSTPLLITQFAGAGRTALQASDETYRWTSFGGSDIYYQRYWGQMLRWLSRGKLSGAASRGELLVDPKQARYGQPIRFQVTLAGDGEGRPSDAVELAVEGSQGRRETLSLGRVSQTANVYQATSTEFTPGSYRAVLIRPAMENPLSEDFSVTSPPGEQANLRANVEGMQMLAQQSRGRFYEAKSAERLFAELPPGTPTRLGGLPSIPLWNSPWVALLFVVLITVEWLLRRRYQML